nr:hypothetical protein GUARANI_19 [Guarani virophage]
MAAVQGKTKKVKRDEYDITEDENIIPFDELAAGFEKLYVENEEHKLQIADLEEHLLAETDIKNFLVSDASRLKRENMILKKKFETIAPKTNFKSIMLNAWNKNTEEEKKKIKEKYVRYRAQAMEDYKKLYDNIQ